MNKKAILNGMSEAEFYKLYPTEESYIKAMGGSLSGAPHNGQPTAAEFFARGFVPQGPVGFYKAGGINTNEIAFPQQPTAKQFYKKGFIPQGPVDFYEFGGNLPEAFPQLPPQVDFFSGTPWSPDLKHGGEPCMECGGYMKDGGHWIQKATKTMRKDHPCTGSKFGSSTCPPGSRRYNLAKTFRAMAKKQYGGDNDTDDAGGSPDMDQDDFLENYKNTFMNKIKQNTMMSIADEAAAHADMMMAYGGYIPMAQDGTSIQVSMNPATGTFYTPEEWVALQASGQQAPLNKGATNDPYAGMNLGKMTTWDYQGASAPQFPTPESVGLQNKDPYTTMTPMDPANNGSKPAKTKGPGMNWNNFSGMAAAEGILGTVRGITSFANQLQYAQDANKRKDQTLADNQFAIAPANRIQNQGRYNWTGMSNGMMDPNSMHVIQQPGQNYTMDGYYAQMGGGIQEGQEVELDEDQINQILANGGSVKFLD